MRRLLPAIAVAIGVVCLMTYAIASLFSEVRVSGNGSEGFTCTQVFDWRSAVGPGAAFGIAAGLLFWFAASRWGAFVARRVWLAVFAVVFGSAVAVVLVFPPTEWDSAKECPPATTSSRVALWLTTPER